MQCYVRIPTHTRPRVQPRARICTHTSARDPGEGAGEAEREREGRRDAGRERGRGEREVGGGGGRVSGRLPAGGDGKGEEG